MHGQGQGLLDGPDILERAGQRLAGPGDRQLVARQRPSSTSLQATVRAGSSANVMAGMTTSWPMAVFDPVAKPWPLIARERITVLMGSPIPVHSADPGRPPRSGAGSTSPSLRVAHVRRLVSQRCPWWSCTRKAAARGARLRPGADERSARPSPPPVISWLGRAEHEDPNHPSRRHRLTPLAIRAAHRGRGSIRDHGPTRCPAGRAGEVRGARPQRHAGLFRGSRPTRPPPPST